MTEPAAWSQDPYTLDPSVEGAATPIWREGFAAIEWASLRFSPVFYGCGVTRGNGEPVVVVPGFMASDLSLVELVGWLGRMGYRPYFSGIGRNTDCPNATAEALLKTVRKAHEETGQRVAVIGHSLGGMLARSVALDHPEEISVVISLGSPFRDAVRAHPAVLAASEALRQRGRSPMSPNLRPSCFSGHCTCPFVRNMLQPEQYRTAHHAVYSKTDGIVDWRSCREGDASHDHEVQSTHVGMIANPQVYRLVGQLLAQESAAAA